MEAGIPQICIFMTDGQSTNVRATALAANDVRILLRSQFVITRDEPITLHLYIDR